MIFVTFILPLFFLCWGSFLNVVGYRILIGKSVITPRSACPHCGQILAWYDLIPVLSWIALRGRCRTCNRPISWLYPFIELLTAIILTLMIYRVASNWLAYGLFFSILIVDIRTDLQDLLISRFFSLYAAPLGVFAALCGWLPISWVSSLAGGLVGYGILWGIAALFAYCTGKEGLGAGDYELMALIGCFIGIGGIAPTLLIASLTGTLCGLILIISGRATRETKIPFGPFLALGAIVYVLFGPIGLL